MKISINLKPVILTNNEQLKKHEEERLKYKMLDAELKSVVERAVSASLAAYASLEGAGAFVEVIKISIQKRSDLKPFVCMSVIVADPLDGSKKAEKFLCFEANTHDEITAEFVYGELRVAICNALILLKHGHRQMVDRLKDVIAMTIPADRGFWQ